MANAVVYLVAKQNIEADNEAVELGTAADLYCEDHIIQAKLSSLVIYRFKKGEGSRAVLSVVDIIGKMTALCPGITVNSLGETDIIIDKASLQKDKGNKKKNAASIIKVAIVSLICFFGTAFTIMAFHNDIGINEVFAKLYELLTGTESDGFTELELAYSIGLFVGITVFYNHIGNKRLDSDPTPLEVEMRVYEKDVNQAIIELSERNNKEERKQ